MPQLAHRPLDVLIVDQIKSINVNIKFDMVLVLPLVVSLERYYEE
jgi:hypothetical protein